MPRVLIAGFTALPGPHRIGVQLRHVMRALLRHYRVDVLVLRRGEQAYVERVGNARILRVPVPDGEIRGRVEAFGRALRRQLEGADYDVVHFADGWAGQTVLELRDRLKFAAVYDAGRSPLTGTLPLDHAVVSELERAEIQCARSADLVLAPTEPARQYLASLGPPQRVHLVAPGVDVDLFDWDMPVQADGRPPVILYAGTVSQGRGIQVLLGAMLELLRRTEAELILAGRAGREFRQNLTSTLRELGLDRRVKFGGVIEHSRVPELIARSTICVVPGAPEITANRLAIYPTKLLEYLACQRPVIAPRRSSVSLLLRDGQTCLMFEPGQPGDLADKIEILIKDAALRGRLARAGYELVRRSHSASSTRRELRRAYEWLASISPWRERFAASVDDMPEAEVRLPGPGDTEAGSRIPRGDSDPMRLIDSAEIILETSSDSGSMEVGDPVGEVTRVEVSPLMDADTKSTSLFAIDESKGDDWVVEDSNTRPSEQSGVLGEVPSDTSEHHAASPKSAPVSSMDATFVAGEIRGEGDRTDEIVLDEQPLTAESALLGILDEDEKTRLFSIPIELSEATLAETKRGPSIPVSESDNDEETQIASMIPPPTPARTQNQHPQSPPQTIANPPPGPKPPPTPRTPPPPPGQSRRRAVRVADSESPSTKPFPRLPSPEGAAGPERE